MPRRFYYTNDYDDEQENDTTNEEHNIDPDEFFEENVKQLWDLVIKPYIQEENNDLLTKLSPNMDGYLLHFIREFNKKELHYK